MRTEFGLPRTTCGCETCVDNCKNMPGFLIPADLERIRPKDMDPFVWAKKNLLASPGAIVRDTRKNVCYRIPTLVPATKADGSCIHLTAENLCLIHEIAPFGCAFFDCRPEDEQLASSKPGLLAIIDDFRSMGLYSQIW
jgi:hypothetical protein